MSKEAYEKIVADSDLPPHRWKRYERLSDAEKEQLGLTKKPAKKATKKAAKKTAKKK